MFLGTAGDSLGHHRGMAFSTKDYDNDKASGYNCALSYSGGWWFKACHTSDLNGLYEPGITARRMVWWHWKNNSFSVMKRSEMKIRPEDF